MSPIFPSCPRASAIAQREHNLWPHSSASGKYMTSKQIGHFTESGSAKLLLVIEMSSGRWWVTCPGSSQTPLHSSCRKQDLHRLVGWRQVFSLRINMIRHCGPKMDLAQRNMIIGWYSVLPEPHNCSQMISSLDWRVHIPILPLIASSSLGPVFTNYLDWWVSDCLLYASCLLAT